MRKNCLVQSAAFGVFILLTACAGGPRPNTQALQAARTDSSIRASRAALGRAAQLWQADSVARLLAPDAGFSATVMGLEVSRQEVLAFTASRGASNTSLLFTPKQVESCLDAGYETGAFTYRSTSDPSVLPRYGSYAIAWTTVTGSAFVKTLVVDTVRDPRRIARNVSCLPWRAVQLRSRRAIVTVTPVKDNQGLPKSIYDDLAAAGWNKGWADGECSAIGDKHLDYANAASAIDINSVVHPDALSAFIGVRYRINDRFEVEAAGTPKAAKSCSTGYNPNGSTGISTFFEGKSYAAYISRRFGDLRVGIGPTLQQATVSLRQANVRATNPNRGNVSSELSRVSTSKTLSGIGGIVGYTLPLGRGFIADLDLRLSKGGSLKPPALSTYTPKSVSASSSAIGVSLGWAW